MLLDESFPVFEECDPSDLRRIKRQILASRKLLLEVEQVMSAEKNFEKLLVAIKDITHNLGTRINL